MIGNNYLKQLASLKVVFTSCSGCFLSQNAWVRNAGIMRPEDKGSSPPPGGYGNVNEDDC